VNIMSIGINSPLNMLQSCSPLGGIQQALQGIQQSLQGLQQLLQPLSNLLQNPLGSALSAAGQGVNQALGALGQAANAPLGGLGQALGGLGQALGGVTQGLQQALNMPNQMLGGLNQGLNQALNMPNQMLGGLNQALNQGFNGLNQAISGIGQAAAQGAGGQLLQGLTQAVGGLGGALGAASALAGQLGHMNQLGQMNPMGQMGQMGNTGGPMTAGECQGALLKGMQNSGMTKMTNQDFKDAANGICPKGMQPQDFTPEFQQACRQMQANPNLKPDTADADNVLGRFGMKGKADGTVGIGDLSASLQKQGISGDQRGTVQTLKDNFSALSKDGKTFDLDTVKNIGMTGQMPNGSLASPQLQQACQKFAADTALNFAADNAQQIAQGRMDQRGDQKFSMKDLEKTLAR
jgi:hypothetical protein